MVISPSPVITSYSIHYTKLYDWEAVVNLDYSMIMAVTLLDGAFLVVANLAMDLLYTAVDPRIRTS